MSDDAIYRVRFKTSRGPWEYDTDFGCTLSRNEALKRVEFLVKESYTAEVVRFVPEYSEG